jgi:hypothetical protein
MNGFQYSIDFFSSMKIKTHILNKEIQRFHWMTNKAGH